MPAPKDYIDVAARLREWYEKYPEGAVVTDFYGIEKMGEKDYIVFSAVAYRDPGDERPAGTGWAWELYPGPTNFTRDSEMMNAETSAVGRALVNGGLPSKKVASADEVEAAQSRQSGDDGFGI